MSMLVLAVAGMLAGLSPDPDPEFEAGKAAFSAGRYAEAAEHFERAHEKRPDPVLLFVWAQAERQAGDCAAAVPLYRRYLDLDPPDPDVKVTRAAIKACGEDPDVVPDPPPVPDTGEESRPEPDPDLEPDPEPDPEPEPDKSKRPRTALRDPWGHTLTWPGVALAAIGGGLLGEAHRRRRRAALVLNELAYRETLDGAPVLSRVGIGVLIGGGALLTAGIVRFVVVAVKSRRSTRAAVAPKWSPGGLVWKFELAPRGVRALR